MQLPQLLKQYKLTAQQLTTLLAQHVEVPNLRLVREVPANWEAILLRELGQPTLLTTTEQVTSSATTQGGQFSETPAAAPGGVTVGPVEPIIAVAPAIPFQHLGEASPAKRQAQATPRLEQDSKPTDHTQYKAEAWKIGRLVEVIDNRYGRICPAGSTEQLHLPGPAIRHEFPPKNSWLLFTDRPNKKNPALTDIYRAVRAYASKLAECLGGI